MLDSRRGFLLVFSQFCWLMLVHGGELSIDSSFPSLRAVDNAPLHWAKQNAHQGGAGACKLLPARKKGVNAVQVLTTARVSTIYYEDMFKAGPGDRITLDADVKGEGTFSLTLYVYDSGFIVVLPLRLVSFETDEYRTIRQDFILDEKYRGRVPSMARVAFCIGPESLVTVENVRGSITRKGTKK